MTSFVSFVCAAESPKEEYVWAEPADEASADNSQSGQAGDAAPGFTVKPIN